MKVLVASLGATPIDCKSQDLAQRLAGDGVDAAFDAGFEATRSLILGLIMGPTLIVLMTFSYLYAKRAERSVPYLQ